MINVDSSQCRVIIFILNCTFVFAVTYLLSLALSTVFFSIFKGCEFFAFHLVSFVLFAISSIFLGVVFSGYLKIEDGESLILLRFFWCVYTGRSQ